MIENEYYVINYSVDTINYIEKLYQIQKEIDQENWSYFGIESQEEFGIRVKRFVGSISLTRLILLDGEVVGYIESFIMKKEVVAMLYEDNYKEYGLDITDFVIDYSECMNLSDYVLYVNVVAIKNKFQGAIGAILAMRKAVEEIYAEVKKQRVSDIVSVAVTENGNRMCNMMRMKVLSSVVRDMNETSHTRTLYIGGKNANIK